MKTCDASLLLLAGLLVCACARAHRQVSKADAYKNADTVLVGYVSSVRIPALERAENLSPAQARVGLVIHSPRVIRMVVIAQAKGKPCAHVRRIRLTRGQGLLVQAGDRVIAFRFSDGSWRIDSAPRMGRDIHLPPLPSASEVEP